MRSPRDRARPHRGTVVLVEEDESLNVALSRLLQAAGFTTCAFTSAEALLQSLHAQRADCFVLDAHLPGMSGFDLQLSLSRLGIRAPAIVITAHDDATHQRAAQEVGAFAYLTKPFSTLSLLDAVDRALAAGAAPSSP